MYHKFIFIILNIVFQVTSANAQNIKQDAYFELNGKSNTSKNGDKIYLTYEIRNKIYFDSTKIDKEKFSFKGNIYCPVRAFISNGKKFRMDGVSTSIIYIEPKKMNLTIDYNNFKKTIIENSKTNDEFLFLEKQKDKISLTRDSIYNLIQLNREEGKVNKDSVQISFFHKRTLELDKLINEINVKEIELEFDFINKNPNSFISPDLLLFRIRRREGIIHYNTIEALYKNLPTNVRDSYSGVELGKAIINLKNSGLGMKAVDFTVNDINNNQVSLNTIREKKYILIDFWASWCAPCREDFPFLNEMFQKYSPKGFDIISISRDENLELWKKAIIKDEISNWKHISIKENYNLISNNIIEEKYFVTTIPVKILINKEGVIIGRWRGGGEENKLELKKMLNKIFENN